MTLNAWLDNWQSCSHTSDTSRDTHSYLIISASFNSIAYIYNAVKFCVRLNENATGTYEKLKRAYGEHALSKTQFLGA